jgi:zinc protease
LRSLTELQLANAAKKFIRPNEVVWIVVGDLSKIEKGIRELNLGDIIKLNADGEPIN